LQDLIPVFAFLRWKVSPENEITPGSFAPDTRDRLINHSYQPTSGLICVESGHDFSAFRQFGNGRPNQFRLPASRRYNAYSGNH
jgi:hypothetical protein